MTGSSSDSSSSSSRYSSTNKDSRKNPIDALFNDEKQRRKPVKSNSVKQKLFFSCFAFGASVLFVDTILKNNLLPSDKASFLSKVIFPFTYPISALKRITNYWTEIDDTLLLGCAPMAFLGHPNSLYKQNVRGVINLCDEYQGPKEAYSELGIEQLYLPTIDHSEPSYPQIITAVDFISKYKMRGERVLVHCKAGHARSASIALCWLLNEDPTLAPPVS
jgi:atypical dual specificity phosphatase